MKIWCEGYLPLITLWAVCFIALFSGPPTLREERLLLLPAGFGVDATVFKEAPYELKELA
jgi:hypothetical protein